MKRESYYIPVLIYGSLLEKRGKAGRGIVPDNANAERPHKRKN